MCVVEERGRMNPIMGPDPFLIVIVDILSDQDHPYEGTSLLTPNKLRETPRVQHEAQNVVL